MSYLRALLLIGLLVVLIVSTCFIASTEVIFHLPLDALILWVLMLAFIPLIWFLVSKISPEDQE